MDIQEQLRSALKEIDRLKKENIQLKKNLYKAQGPHTSYSLASNEVYRSVKGKLSY
ncbi:hypothetical protein [Bacillus sp. FJAT-45350]|uniref:hypothetical protein n=1 Tax=Bacillus sp. FJAT-45350 TaxID=2011014 RepID=UPI0015CE9EEC|nr:hypothetical protein [Bacillus sp. FJAT-45350]